jgi:mannose-6-phosphate isomerase-like protein (cupin superfamily)
LLGPDGAATHRSRAQSRQSGRGHSQAEERVLTILDINAEVAKLRMLHGRTPETPEADREGAFARLAPYRDSAINVAKFSGEGPWERHINGDEIVQIVDGSTTFHIITADGPQSHTLKTGMVVIVPQGEWHRFEAPDGVTLMTTTPQPTQHLTFAIDDPRTLD